MLLPGGLFTNDVSPTLNGALRSPYLKKLPEGGSAFNLAVALSRRSVPSSTMPFHRAADLSFPSRPRLVERAGCFQFVGRNVYREIATKTSNPNFPPVLGWAGLVRKRKPPTLAVGSGSARGRVEGFRGTQGRTGTLSELVLRSRAHHPRGSRPPVRGVVALRP